MEVSNLDIGMAALKSNSDFGKLLDRSIIKARLFAGDAIRQHFPRPDLDRLSKKDQLYVLDMVVTMVVIAIFPFRQLLDYFQPGNQFPITSTPAESLKKIARFTYEVIKSDVADIESSSQDPREILRISGQALENLAQIVEGIEAEEIAVDFNNTELKLLWPEQHHAMLVRAGIVEVLETVVSFMNEFMEMEKDSRSISEIPGAVPGVFDNPEFLASHKVPEPAQEASASPEDFFRPKTSFNLN